MTSIKEHHITTFTKAGITHPAHPGEFLTASGYLFSKEGRPSFIPSWTAQATIPVAAAGTMDVGYIATQDISNSRYILWIGKEGSALYASAWGSSTVYQELTSAVSALGGQDRQNVIFTDSNQLFLIGSNGHVYTGPYTAALSDVYTTGDAKILCIWNNNVILVTTSGDIYLWNGSDAFTLIYTPSIALAPLFATPYRGYLLIATINADGTLVLHQFTGDYTLRTLYQIGNIPYQKLDASHAFTILQGDVYFTTRAYTQNLDGTYAVEVYKWDGTQITWVATATISAPVPAAVGLLSIQHDTLALYAIRNGSADNVQEIYTLVGDHFTTLTSHTEAQTVANVSISQTGSQIVLHMVIDGAARMRVFNYGAMSIPDSQFAGNSIQTGWMDFDTSTQKLLQTITVQFSPGASSLNASVFYRINGATGWTEATYGSTARLTIENLNLHFYTLDIRVTTTPGNNITPAELSSISIIYTRQ